MKITPAHVGTCVSWPVPRGTVTVRITSVGRDHVSYVCTDGYHEPNFTSLFLSLDDITDGWRPATPEETADFARRYRPAPENWD